VSGRSVFLAATQENAEDLLATKGVTFEPLYTARYSVAWEKFHRRLPRGDFVDASEQKLSLWKVSSAKR
jgi:hypothetical protein